MSRPKVSIVIPTYNVEGYLRECLDSVRRQTLRDIEVVCVNDGSTDGSLAIIEEYAAADPRFVVLDGPNGGYGRAMNRGMAAATGEYVGIVEPDDFVALSMYEDLYDAAVANDLDVVKADFYRFRRDEGGDMLLRYCSLDPTGEWYGRVIDSSCEPEALRLTMNTWSGIYRREFLLSHDIQHNETPGASFQDNGFWVQTFVFARRVMVLDKPYYMNRRDNPNSSVNDPSKVYCMRDEYDHIEELLRPQKDVWGRFGAMVWFLRFRNYLFTADRIDSSRMREFMCCARDEFAQAKAKGELDEMLFPIAQRRQLRAILANSDVFAICYAAERRARRVLKNLLMSLKGVLPKF